MCTYLIYPNILPEVNVWRYFGHGSVFTYWLRNEYLTNIKICGSEITTQDFKQNFVLGETSHFAILIHQNIKCNPIIILQTFLEQYNN